MRKFLYTMVVLYLLLSAGALFLGIQLYNKREILKGRAHKLEESLINIAKTIESADQDPGITPRYPERDIDRVEDEEIPNPETTKFWASYDFKLENPENPKVNLNAKRDDLKNYFLMDPATQKPKLNAAKQRTTTGKGTMQYILDDLKEKANAQLARLTITRAELTKVRTELIVVIEKLNTRKNELREKLIEITRLHGVIADRDNTIAELRRTIADKDMQINGLNNDIAELNDQIRIEQATNELQRAEILDKNRIIAEHESRPTTGPNVGPDREGRVPRVLLPEYIEHGDKGRLVTVNSKHSFVIMKLNAEFMDKIKPDEKYSLPILDLLIKRRKADGKSHEYITKIRLRDIRPKEGIAIGDILYNWQQDEPKVGDVIFY